MARDRNDEMATPVKGELVREFTKMSAGDEKSQMRSGLIDKFTRKENGVSMMDRMIDKMERLDEFGPLAGILKELIKEQAVVNIAILGTDRTISASIITDPADWVYDEKTGKKLHRPTVDHFIKFGDGIKRHPKCANECWMSPDFIGDAETDAILKKTDNITDAKT